MGRVECITCQVPVSHSTEGGVKSSAGLGEVVVGDRIFNKLAILKCPTVMKLLDAGVA